MATPNSFAWINASWGNPEFYYRFRVRSMAEWKRLAAALPALGGPGGRFLVGFADGSVRTMRRDRIEEKTLRAMITIAGGEVIVIP